MKSARVLNKPPKKILIINIFGLGDVLFTTPLVANLKKFWPKVQIGYLGNKRVESILSAHPLIDQYLIYERDDFVQVYRQSKIKYVKNIIGLIREIRSRQYDMVIDVSLNSFTSFLTWAARIPHRIGLNYKNRSYLLNQKIPIKGYEKKHVVEYYLDILTELGIPIQERKVSLNISQEDKTWASGFLSSKRIKPKQKLVALVPGGGASWGKEAIYKRWSVQNFAELADKMIEKFSVTIILLGDKHEMGLCQEVLDFMEHTPLIACGQTTVSQFAALTQKCVLTIVNDGGPLHIAVAAGAQTLSLFGPVDYKVYGPYPIGKHIVVTKGLACQPCYRSFRRARCDHISCLNQITVEEILQKAGEVL